VRLGEVKKSFFRIVNVNDVIGQEALYGDPPFYAKIHRQQVLLSSAAGEAAVG
jgi:hypothetical protein